MPSLSLLSAGSNARGQLATGDTEDAHTFVPCTFAGCEPGALPAGTQRVDLVQYDDARTVAARFREHVTNLRFRLAVVGGREFRAIDNENR